VDANFEIECSDCGTTYSADEPSCPHCQQPEMKIPNRKVEEPKASEKGKDSDESTWRWQDLLPDWTESLFVLIIIGTGTYPISELERVEIGYDGSRTFSYSMFYDHHLWSLAAIALGVFLIVRAIGVLCWKYKNKLKNKLVGSGIRKSNQPKFDEEDFYSAATIEASGNGRNEGLWGKCFVEADGNENKTKVLYIKRRVEQLEESPPDSSKQEEESFWHWWKRIIYAAAGIGYLLAAFGYYPVKDYRYPGLDDLVNFVIWRGIGYGLGLMFCAWILAGFPWLFFKLTKKPLSKRGYILCFIGGFVITALNYIYKHF
jgi:hypothetical protein